MNTDERYDPLDDGDLRTLLRDAVSDVHPEPALDAIRQRTRGATGVRRVRPLFVVTAAAATVAAIVGGITLANQRGTAPSPPALSTDPAKAGTPTAKPSNSPSITPVAGSTLRAIAVYFVGDTPQGPRLYREFQAALIPDALHVPKGGSSIFTSVLRALGASTSSRHDGKPSDPDYRTLWPTGTEPTAAEAGNGTVTLSLTNRTTDLVTRPLGMSAAEAELSVQQLVYSVQAALQKRRPLRFQIDGRDTRTLLGVDVSGPVSAKPQLDVLALVNITEPAEGATVRGSFRAHGVASSFEANVPWEIRQGSVVVKRGASTASGWTDALYPWTTDPLDVSDLAPGSYTFVALTDDPSGGEGGGPQTDTRTIVVRR